jgi:hypothetical protein
VCERPEIRGDINNVQSLVSYYQAPTYTGAKYVHPLGQLQQDSQRQYLHQHQENAHSSMHTIAFQGQQWYNWALVSFQEGNNQGEQIENHYPSKILGYFCIEGIVKL